MATNAEDIAEMNLEFKKWDADVSEIVTNVDQANARTRAVQDAWMKELRACRDAAHARMREFAGAQGVAAEGLRPAMAAARRAMEQALIKVRKDLSLQARSG